MDESVNKQRVHRLLLTNRKSCTLSGVVDVLSFDLTEILLETDQGMLMMKGADLHVNRLANRTVPPRAPNSFAASITASEKPASTIQTITSCVYSMVFSLRYLRWRLLVRNW